MVDVKSDGGASGDDAVVPVIDESGRTAKALAVVVVGEDGNVANPGGASENHIGEVGGAAVVLTADITRPGDTTAYASGDLVANSTTAGSVTPMSFAGAARVSGGTGMIRRARIRKTGTGITNASFRVHIYKASPTVTNGDNGVWLSDNAANYLGAFDVTVDKAFSDGAAGNGAPLVGSEITFDLSSGTTLYGLLEARGAYTPANGETFTVGLEILQN